MDYAAYIKDNYIQKRRSGKLELADGVYNFQVVDRKGGSFVITNIYDDFVILEDSSSFSVISRVIVPMGRFTIQHNIDKDLGRKY